MSIRRRMTLSLTGATLLLLILAGVMLLLYMRHQLLYSYDQSLLSRAQALCTLLHADSTGKVDFNFADEAMPEFNPGRSAEYFQLWSASGDCVERSPSLGSQDLLLTKTFLARHSDNLHTFIDLPLPDNRPGRAVVLSFHPGSEEEKDDRESLNRGSRLILLAVARDRRTLDHTLAIMTGGVLCTIIALAAGIGLLTPWLIRRHLRPLGTIAEQLRAVDAGSLGQRFRLEGRPDELVPICARLNDSLDKLEAAFDRERRFSADVAHELRTPIAELRLLSDLALKFPPEPAATRKSFQDAHDIARQMEAIVVTLLELNQSHPNPASPLSSALLAPIVESAWKPFAGNSQNISLRCDDLRNLSVVTHPDALERLIANLFDNAVDYATAGTEIRLQATAGSDHLRLILSNRTTSLEPADLAHLGEPFWRKDSSRTGNRHAGLGLSLVRAYAKRLHIILGFSLPEPSLFQTSLDIPTVTAGDQENRPP